MRGTVGIYIHIPFCVRKCGYCDFLSFPADEAARGQYVDCLEREILDWDPAIGGEDAVAPTGASAGKPVADTIFFGGGTPSILSASQIGRLLEAVAHRYDVPDGAEVTLECNPGTAGPEKFREYRRLGINRISFGVQSAVDSELEKLGRIHTFGDAADCFRQARRAGFENINADLMSAIPGQTAESYRYTLDRVLELEPEHISAYSLIVEEGTPFYEKYGDVPPVDEETDRSMYALTKEVLAGRGYRRYEISNYARNGFSCRHNLKYWSGGDYIGFGLGASSKIGRVRYKNEAVPASYIDGVRRGVDIREVEEVLEPADEMSEFFVLGLRRTDGVSKKEFAEKFSSDAMDIYGRVIQKSVADGLLECGGDRIRFTDRGLDVSNYVLCQFI